MHLKAVSPLLVICVLVLFNRPVFGVEDQDHSTIITTSISGCVGSEATVTAIVNASNNYLLETVIVNCLSFSDNASAISLGIVSHRQAGGSQGSRSTVRCVNDVLVFAGSSYPFDYNVTACHECEDSQQLNECPNDSGMQLHDAPTMHEY